MNLNLNRKNNIKFDRSLIKFVNRDNFISAKESKNQLQEQDSINSVKIRKSRKSASPSSKLKSNIVSIKYCDNTVKAKSNSWSRKIKLKTSNIFKRY